MSAFGAWALSIVGVVLIGLLIDIVMPEGQTNKYVKSVFAVMTVFVIAAPLPKLLSGSLDLGEIFGDSASYEIDNSFLEALNRQKVAALKERAAAAFTAAGYAGVEYAVTHETREGALVITHIFVDLGKASYGGQAPNTDSTNGVKDILCNIFGVGREVISVYG